ncbi:MAG: FtsW/RodA/SpoVE family cell cycle protein [Acidimicrobiales bacterium]
MRRSRAKAGDGVPRRRVELGLLVLVAIVAVAEYVLASLGSNGKIPANVLAFLGVTLGLALVAHVATRLLAPAANPVLLPIAALLNGLGYVMIATQSSHLAILQSLWSAVGIIAYVGTLFFITYSGDLSRYRYLLAAGGIAMLLSPLVPGLGVNISGTRLWVHLGPLSFQPVELAKIALAIFFASYLVEKRELMTHATRRVRNFLLPDLRTFGPVVVAWGVSMLVMVAEHDIGFALLIFVLFMSMLYVATGRATYLAVAAVLFVAGTFIGMHLFAHVRLRIAYWLDPWPYIASGGYQIIQGMFGLAAGGVSGTGLGRSNLTLIPLAYSDYIFAAIGEEMGLLGSASVVFAFLIFVATGIRIALKSRSDFSKLLAAGLSAIFGFQAFFIMAGIVRILPLTGVTLPFVAYGGSALVSNYILLALLQRISTEANNPGPPPPRRFGRKRAVLAGPPPKPVAVAPSEPSRAPEPVPSALSPVPPGLGSVPPGLGSVPPAPHD